MATKKITDLVELISAASGDVLPIVDISDDITKKIQVSNFPISTAAQTAIDAKQDTLVSGTNIKTINSTSLLGSGDVDVQETLVSGTNIKTLNSESLLGSGNIEITASPAGVAGAIQFSDGSAFTSDATNLFYDDTNDRLGVGINTPTARLHVKGSGSTSATTAFLVQNSAGTAALTILDNREATFGGGISATGFTYSSVSNLSLNCRVTTTNGGNPQQRLFSAEGTPYQTVNPTTSFHDIRNFEPSSGSALYTAFQWSGTINQTGTANGIVRGLYINPTVTAAADFRAIEVTEGNVLIGNAVANTAKLAVKGNGTAGSTTAFRVQNSAGQTAFNIFDNLIVSVQQDLQLGNTTIFWQSGYQIRNKANGLIITGAAGAATGALGLGMSSGTDVNSKAVLELASTTKGFLPPRMTTTQKNAIATPPAGLVVYDTDLNKLCLYTTAWETITSS